ncbi:branched-chain amino acid ABC transporter permease [Pseudonocardia nematodicida]|uniref:Branched-chain amino acid ABC transporter permease n=1 Tax=Pseudonocardia nematodicida TaxID=1206997 RepID=A0ABV1K5N5_9PSEU
MGEIVAALVAGVAGGVPLFVVASGLTLIYGVMRVLNFAHGALFALGAFVLATVLGGAAPSPLMLVVALLVAAVVVGAVGAVSEVTIFRRLYTRDHTTTLLASYALLLTLGGLTEQIWGVTPRSQAQAIELAGAVGIGGIRVAVYDLVLIGIGLVLAAGLTVLLRRSSFGQNIRAVAHDETMARALGVRARRVQLPVFVLGSALAGLAGALIAPLVSIEPGLAPTFVVQSFAVVIIGGLGSIPGALVAALLIGVLESFAVSFQPGLVGFSLYIGVAAVLLLRPGGLLSTSSGLREA